jgi:hypothetical protein
MKCGEFIGELFRARDITHIEHLQSKNMAEHVVLEELYDALLEHADSIAEMRLARGPVPIAIKSIPEETDVKKYLEHELLPQIDAAKEHADEKGMNDISAEIDMVKTTVMKKLYKLKNLVGKEHLKSLGIEGGENKMKEMKVPLKRHKSAEDKLDGGILYKKKCGGGKIKCGGGKIKS